MKVTVSTVQVADTRRIAFQSAGVSHATDGRLLIPQAEMNFGDRQDPFLVPREVGIGDVSALEECEVPILERCLHADV